MKVQVPHADINVSHDPSSEVDPIIFKFHFEIKTELVSFGQQKINKSFLFREGLKLESLSAFRCGVTLKRSLKLPPPCRRRVVELQIVPCAHHRRVIMANARQLVGDRARCNNFFTFRYSSGTEKGENLHASSSERGDHCTPVFVAVLSSPAIKPGRNCHPSFHSTEVIPKS